MALHIDHARINAAIAKAESTTSGEITCMIKAKALDHSDTPLMWATGAALVLPLAFGLFGLWPQDLVMQNLPASLKVWEAAHANAQYTNLTQSMAIFSAIQLVIFGCVFAFTRLPAIKLALTPGYLKRRRAHQKAFEQFYSRGLHLTHNHTGVLIFCALAERYVTVIADEAIFTRVDAKLWDETVAQLLSHIRSGDLTSGFESAIEACGRALSSHFPPDAVNLNELPDVLIEI